MSVKVRFTFVAEASATDSRTTVVCLRFMQFEDDDSDTLYAFPEKLVDIRNHDELMKLPSAKTAKKNLTQRGKRRTFRVTLPPDVAAEYVDSDGNPVFNGEMLDEFVETPKAVVSRSNSPSRDNKPRSLKSIVKDAVIPKFGVKGKAVSAQAWLTIFESECVRLEIVEDQFWQVLRLFVEESAEKWYESTRITTTSTSWEFWRNSFLDSFGQKGWSNARSAFAFRYTTGSLSDYVQTKMNLLVSFNPKIDDFTLMAQIVCGLPLHLQERIDVVETPTVGKLISKINSFNPPPTRFFTGPLKSSSPAFSSLKRSLCGYCKKKGLDRFHLEKDCYTKIRDSQSAPGVYVKKNESRAVNNTVISDLASQIAQESKNE